MRNLRFILAAIAILLTGAVAAGLAARAVTAPDGEQVQSAGTVTIPTVLGQTAEEVLFYPWSLYDIETLYPLPDDVSHTAFGVPWGELVTWDPSTLGELSRGNQSDLVSFLCAFELPAGPVQCDIPDLAGKLLWNVDEDGHEPAGGTHLFLDRFPARLQDSGTDVTLSMAMNIGTQIEDLSFLIRPAEPRDLTEAERQAALTQVKEELLDLLLNALYFNYELTDEELYHGWLVRPDEIAPDYRPADGGELPGGSGGIGITAVRPDEGGALGRMLRDYLRPDGSYCREKAAYQLMYLFPSWNQPDLIWYNFSEVPTLDDLLTMTADLGLSVQIITTQEQIVVLFSGQHNSAILGVYYDVQLDCWSGIGWRASG